MVVFMARHGHYSRETFEGENNNLDCKIHNIISIYPISNPLKQVGYPDIFLEDRHGRPNYIECKTYNERNYQTTQRSFYFSPAERPTDFKVIHDARHIVVSFKIERAERDGKNAFVPVHWKIFSIDDLIGQIKHEFNSTNKQMYTKKALLAEGSF